MMRYGILVESMKEFFVRYLVIKRFYIIIYATNLKCITNNMEIKDIYGKVLYSDDTCNSIKELVEKAVKHISLRGACLVNADLQGASLNDADFDDVVLSGANLAEASLENASLERANLYGANLSCANLRGVDLAFADLAFTELTDTDLKDANLKGVDLNLVDLRGAKNVPYIPLACPSDGAFIAWKKINNCLIKLEIMEDSKRSSATTTTCRCDKAKILSIMDLNTKKEIVYKQHTYKAGDIMTDDFDDNRWNECSNNGIHFFINKQDAINQ